MDLEELSNEELIDRFETIEPLERDWGYIDPKIADAFATLEEDPDGFEVDDDSREIIINYIREEESSRQPITKRRIEGGRRRKTRRDRKTKRSKKTRLGRKSRKTRQSRRR
jgi:hypothetical protein